MAERALEEKVQQHLDNVDEQDLRNRIRLAAYGIWEEEGRPEGRSFDHWCQAEQNTRSGGTPNGKTGQ